MNTELFKKINDIINPVRDDTGRRAVNFGVFDMCTWEDGTGCGTTRCVAGWAVHLATGTPLYEEPHLLRKEVAELADWLGVDHQVPDIAMVLLGLEERERRLFCIDEARAVEFVALASEGQEDEARRVLW